MLSKKKDLYSHLLGFLTKRGSKVLSKKIVDRAFFQVSKKLNLSTDLILLKIFTKLNTYIEIKKVKRGRSSHIVPFAVVSHRRYYLAFNFLMSCVFDNKKQIPFYKKLESEIFDLLTKKYSLSLKKKESNIQFAIKNKSNLHYRW